MNNYTKKIFKNICIIVNCNWSQGAIAIQVVWVFDLGKIYICRYI